MSKLPVISGSECAKVLGKVGFLMSRQRGSHMILVRDNPRITPQKLWQYAADVSDPIGNSSVGEFTRNSAKRNDYQCSGNKAMRWSG